MAYNTIRCINAYFVNSSRVGGGGGGGWRGGEHVPDGAPCHLFSSFRPTTKKIERVAHTRIHIILLYYFMLYCARLYIPIIYPIPPVCDIVKYNNNGRVYRYTRRRHRRAAKTTVNRA